MLEIENYHGRVATLNDELENLKDDLYVAKKEFKKTTKVDGDVLSHHWKYGDSLKKIKAAYENDNIKKVILLIDMGTNLQKSKRDLKKAIRKEFGRNVKIKVWTKKKNGPKTADIYPHEKIIAKNAGWAVQVYYGCRINSKKNYLLYTQEVKKTQILTKTAHYCGKKVFHSKLFCSHFACNV